jgi:hypothetical protein
MPKVQVICVGGFRIPFTFAPSANLAQLVEHFIRNERVVGSIPIVGSGCIGLFRI